ncbi:MAG TPA: fused response regulator/phosphatase, partial [Rhodobacteraceae bacterium]|nr:fused response regulator/phosphatase [Paracoccaceae bacterium]
MLNENGLLDLVRSSDGGPGGLMFLGELFDKLKMSMAPGARLDDDISAALFEFNHLTSL